MVFPRRFGSPFLKGSRVRGPGGIGESIDRAEGERIEGGGTGRKRSRKPGALTDISGPSKGLYVGVGPANVPGAAPQPVAYAPQPTEGQPRTEDRSIVTAAGGAAVLGTNANMEKLAAETGAYDIIMLLVWVWTVCELISGRLARHFDRDPETNEVLWFAAPPLNVARRPAPRYSLQYLHWLATKRKKADDDEEEEDSMEVDNPEGDVKRARSLVKPTATEIVDKLLMDMGE